MRVFHSDDYYLHAPKYEYYDSQRFAYAEVFQRVERILAACQSLDLNIEKLSGKIDTSELRVVHEDRYVEYIKHKCLDIRNDGQIMPSNFIRDTYTPLTRHTYEAALKSAYVAQRSAQELIAGDDRSVYALCRPPGHHAERNAMGGYCYLNNAAIAAEVLAAKGRVSILDIDYHHGNGTQHIFYNRSDVQYVSVHAHPDDAFPYFSGLSTETGEGEGAGFNHNFPISPESDASVYMDTLKDAVEVINKFKPQYLVLSLGFDTYEMDPIGGLGLQEAAYKEIGSYLSEKLQYPTALIQEGGYDITKLEDIATNFLQGYLNLN